MESFGVEGRYRVIRQLGQGGMAEVYLALDQKIQREVAVKFLSRSFARDTRVLTRFEREIFAISKLEHPTIVPLYDFGEHDGQPFIVMRYMAGGSLAEKLKRQNHLNVETTRRIIKRISEALNYGHERGIVHRDIKPGNILFDVEENAYLADYGIAKFVSEMQEQEITGEGILGTPTYISPEQANSNTVIDHRSDIYSLGVLAFQMLTGHVPFQGDTPMVVLLQHVTAEPPTITSFDPNLPSELDNVIQRALRKAPEDRYSTVLEFSRDFERALPVMTAIPGLLVSPEDFATELGSFPTEEVLIPPSPMIVAQKATRKQWLGEALRRIFGYRKSDRKPLTSTSPLLWTSTNLTLNLLAVLDPAKQQNIINLIGRDQELRIKDLIVHYGGGKYLLRGFGRFGATALINQIIEHAKIDLTEQIGANTNGVILAVRLDFSHFGETEKALTAIVREFRLEAIRGRHSRSLVTQFDRIHQRRTAEINSSTEERVISLKASPVPGIETSFSKKVGRQVGKPSKDLSEHELIELIGKFLDRSSRSSEGMERIISRMLSNRNLPSRVIVVIDHIDQPNAFRVLREMRLFDDPRITFFAVVKNEDYIRWPEEDVLEIDKLGFVSHYVSNLWEASNPLIEELLLEAFSQRIENNWVKTFIHHIAFVTRGSPGEVVREILSPQYADYRLGAPLLKLDRVKDIKRITYNAIRQELLEKSWDEILGWDFVSVEDKDQAMLGIYQMVDWIDEQRGFSWKGILKASQSTRLLISRSPFLREKVLRKLIAVLLKNDYLEKTKNDNYIVQLETFIQ